MMEEPFRTVEDGEDVDFLRPERVRDILVVASPGHRANEQEWMDYPALDVAVDLGNGVFLERLSADDLAEQVIEASVARGLNFEATRQFGQMYSFWREIPAAEYGVHPHGWDQTAAITEAIALSRFVCDNAHCAEFAGRVIDRAEGRRKIVPLGGLDARSAYRVRKDRFWLTVEEAEMLHELLDRYRAVKDELRERVTRALWHAERSCHNRYLQEAVTNICSGLEALLNTDEEQVTAQFTQRSRALAGELGIETSATYWNWIYNTRSKTVHGAAVKLVAPAGWEETEGDPPPDVAKVATAQDVLRAAIRKAIEEADFRAIFASDQAIRERWPVRGRGKSLCDQVARLLRRR
jgi:hypothetical protein